jgi:hypothetical protein
MLTRGAGALALPGFAGFLPVDWSSLPQLHHPWLSFSIHQLLNVFPQVHEVTKHLCLLTFY